jgi:protein TonB
MTPIWTHAAAANLDFKSRYARRLETALGLGLLLHLAALVAVPPWEIAPYRLAENPGFTMIDIPDEIDVMPLPPELERPPLPRELAIVDFAPLDATLTPSVTNPFERPALAGPDHRAAEFTVFTEDAHLLKAVDPVYPTLAREAGAEGRVWVEVLIDVTGRVAEARVIRAETVTSLQEAALRAARQYLFSPARQRDKPVPVRLIIPFTFRLR